MAGRAGKSIFGASTRATSRGCGIGTGGDGIVIDLVSTGFTTGA
jgi:hypothetical protein